MAGVRAAQFLSLNDDMSGGTIMSSTLQVFMRVGFGEILAPLGGLIYGRSHGELFQSSRQKAVGSRQ